VNRLVGSPRDAGKTQKSYVEAELEVLVAPCPSLDLKMIISHRKSMAAIRSQLLSLSLMLYSATGATTPHSPTVRLHSNPPSPRENSPVHAKIIVSPRQLSTMESFTGQRDFSFLKVSWTIEEVHHVLNMARIIAETLEEMSAESFPFLQIQTQYESRSPTSDKGKTSNDHILLFTQIYKYYRTRCYTSVLFHLCELFHSLAKLNVKNKKDLDRLIDSPSFSNALISEVPVSSLATVVQHVETDCLLAAQRSPLLSPDGVNGEEFIKSLIAKFNLTLEFAVQRVRDYVLCSAAFWDNVATTTDGLTSGGGNRKSLAIRSLTIEDIETASQQQAADAGTAKRCLQVLVAGYHSKLQSMLANYVSSKESFLKCHGQAFKTGLLKFLIDKNQTLDERLRPTFRALGISVEPKLFILEPTKLLQVIDWYSSIVVAETKEWLSNTLKHVYKTRTNKFDLPWDIEDDPNKVGDRLISDLPETLMRTLNIYLDLCTDDVDVEVALLVEGHSNNSNVGSSTHSSAPKRFLPKGASETNSYDKSRLGQSIESSGNGSFMLKTPRDDGSTIEPHSFSSSQDCLSPEDFQGDIEEFARKFNEMRYRRKLGPRARFLLKVNEKIVGALLQSWNLLGNEYRRALQGKHWGQVIIFNHNLLLYHY